MSVLLLRDDDANATTDPHRLEQLYAPLLDRGVPVSFAVIPEVALDTQAPDGQRERFIALDEPTDEISRRLVWTSPLASWLRARSNVVDVMVHGCTHARVRAGTEFGALGTEEARDRLLAALATVQRALGWAPRAFVAPWDALSRESLAMASRLFDLVSLGWVGRARLHVRHWPAHLFERVTRSGVLRIDNSWVLRHEGCQIKPSTAPEEVPQILDRMVAKASVGVVVLHHADFLHDSRGPFVIAALARALRGYRVVDTRGAIEHLDGEQRGPRELGFSGG